ncbi:glycerate kinase type-2 family protein [Cohaesibacter haloalkalitolerans]|uniref:glycerate kinase type-2 family protein n=1 Tax=Cohaesibacter haloalkalitolerans TaxID=1162980 RepID=UPI000E64E5A3|nr:glycerate kinase [Cohaesibacter haloalkalitolerans]
MRDTSSFLRSLFDAAIQSAQPARCVEPFLPKQPPRGRFVVIGAGKASAAMARAVEDHWDGPLEGLVVTRYGYSVPCKQIEIVEAAHPVPDEQSLVAARRMMDYVATLGEDDEVLCLISGGGSALLSLPLDGITLEDKQAVNRALLASGATITEMNILRRHLSAIKGGRLAAQCYPARLTTLMISDVPGDSPQVIASGPTVSDPTTRQDALDIIDRYKLQVPDSVLELLNSPESESLKPGDEHLSRSSHHIVAAPQLALEAAATLARAEGIETHILGDSLEGEAKDVGTVMAGIVRQIVTRQQPFAKPCLLLSGGETTVTLKGNGRGGRNVEFLLSLAVGLDGLEGVHALAGDTDGVDGAEEIAGAVIAPDTLNRAFAAGMNPRKELANNNAHGFFEALGDSVVTGPTMTNVNDFRAILIG